MLAIRDALLHGPAAPVMRTEAAGPRRFLASTGDCAIPHFVGTSPPWGTRPWRKRPAGVTGRWIRGEGQRCQGCVTDRVALASTGPWPLSPWVVAAVARRGQSVADGRQPTSPTGGVPFPGCDAPTPGTDEPDRAPDASDICLACPPGWQRERMRRRGFMVVSTVPGPGRALHHKPIQPPFGARPGSGCLRMPHGLSEFWTR